MDDLILRAANVAKSAHAGQTRKYRPLPYIFHPARVAARTTLLDDVTPQEIAAAWLHDVIEDTSLTASDLLRLSIPAATVELVQALTNPSKQQPELARAARNRLDREHLKEIPHAAKRIKLIDRTDNLNELGRADAQFKSLYVAESLLLAECLAGVERELEAELFDAIDQLGFPRDHSDPRTGAE